MASKQTAKERTTPGLTWGVPPAPVMAGIRRGRGVRRPAAEEAPFTCPKHSRYVNFTHGLFV